MLVLSRKPEETVVIDGHIKVKILEIRGNQVSIGFTAPRHIAIYRSEVQDEIIKEAKQKARGE